MAGLWMAISTINSSDDFDTIKEHLKLADLELRRASAITNQTLRFHPQSSRTKKVTSADLFDGVLSIFQRRIDNAGIRATVQLRSKPQFDVSTVKFAKSLPTL